MRITSKRLDNLCFVGTTEAGHSVVMEGSAAEGGVKCGPSPMEMLLLGVAGQTLRQRRRRMARGFGRRAPLPPAQTGAAGMGGTARRGRTRRRSPARVYRNPYPFQSVRPQPERNRHRQGGGIVGRKILLGFDYAGQSRQNQPQLRAGRSANLNDIRRPSEKLQNLFGVSA